MAGKNVAVEGDVVATAGTSPFTGADKGTWTAGQISYQSYAKLTVSGQKVIHEASCTYDFSGTTTDGNPILGKESVTLTASPTLLQKGQSQVLVNGDAAKDSKYGNKLEVQTSNVLKTS